MTVKQTPSSCSFHDSLRSSYNADCESNSSVTVQAYSACIEATLITEFFTCVKEHYRTEYMGKARKGCHITGMAQRLTQVDEGSQTRISLQGLRAEAVGGRPRDHSSPICAVKISAVVTSIYKQRWHKKTRIPGVS